MTTAGLFLLFVVLLGLRQPMVILLIACAIYVHLFFGAGHPDYLIEDIWTSLNKELLLAIPLFLMSGAIMTKGQSAEKLIDLISALTVSIRGGLGVATILCCAVFSAVSGSSIVTMMVVGSVLYPAMRAANYPNRFALGAVVSGGTLGIVIPPSIPLILYAFVTKTSVADMFLAGILPGVLLTLLMAGWAIWTNRHRQAATTDWQDVRSALREGIWALLFPVVLLGGIYSGYYTPTESAAVALAYLLTIEFLVYRKLDGKGYFDAVVETATLCGILFPLIAVALSLNLVLIENRIPQLIVDAAQDWMDSPLVFLLAVNLLLLFVGSFLTINEAILILAPILLPIATSFGFHPVHFGIIMIINLEIGFLTPPVGMNLLVAMMAFRQKFSLLVLSVLPFIALLLVGLAITALFPWSSLVLI